MQQASTCWLPYAPSSTSYALPAGELMSSDDDYIRKRLTENRSRSLVKAGCGGRADPMMRDVLS